MNNCNLNICSETVSTISHTWIEFVSIEKCLTLQSQLIKAEFNQSMYNDMTRPHSWNHNPFNARNKIWTKCCLRMWLCFLYSIVSLLYNINELENSKKNYIYLWVHARTRNDFWFNDKCLFFLFINNFGNYCFCLGK